ncbi:MAG TPA: hypothetical protein VFV38_19170 [Ktedonobacteraceae bacterium]|nr:hypothetical protein [Ktedonobacteraceae bacterium]
MSLFGKKHETSVTLYSYEVVEDDTISSPAAENNDPDASTTSGAHCAWCGDPPDRYGSHGICAYHQAQMLEQAAARRRSRGRA